MATQMKTVEVEVVTRAEKGSGPARRLRREGWLPAVVYGEQGKSRPVKLNRHKFELLLKKTGGGHNVILDLVMDGGDRKKALLREIQRDHITDSVTHVDFMEISMARKLRISAEIIFKGDPVGVTQGGGVLEHLLRNIDIECLPQDMLQEVEIDVSNLNVGDSLSVRDLNIDRSKITVLTPPDIAIAAVLMPRIEEEPKPGEAAEAEILEPERIGEKKEGEEAEEPGKEGKEQPKAAKEEKQEKAEKPASKEKK